MGEGSGRLLEGGRRVGDLVSGRVHGFWNWNGIVRLTC